VVCQFGAGGESVGLLRAREREQTGLVPWHHVSIVVHQIQARGCFHLPSICSARALAGSARRSHTETVPFSPEVQMTELRPE
jgi:hypothetical protein